MKLLPLLAFFPLAASAQTFNVSIDSGGVENITGTVVLAPGSSGPILGGAVQSWSFAGSGLTSFSYSGFGASCGSACGLTVANGDLYFEPAQSPFESSIAFGQSAGFGSAGGRNDGGEFETNGYSFAVSPGQIGTDPPSLGVASVPEVSGSGLPLGLTFLGALVLLVTGKQRTQPKD